MTRRSPVTNPRHRNVPPAGPRDANPRALAAQVIARVMAGRYLDDALDEVLAVRPPEAALIQELSYGTLRWFHQLAGIAKLFLEKPLKPKDQDIYALLLAGLYQLRALRVAPHAAVDETVAAAEALGKSWAKGLINACLREYQRRVSEADGAVEKDDALRLSHPNWLLEKFRAAWPGDWERIAAANNERPPFTLRVNLRQTTRAKYLEMLRAAHLSARPDTVLDSRDGGGTTSGTKEVGDVGNRSPRATAASDIPVSRGTRASCTSPGAVADDTDVTLDTPVPVTQLPGFADGLVSVQDAAAQWAAALLDAQPGQHVLDACAAPGGKTGHILERTPGLAACVAVDRAPARVARIEANLKRLGLTARLVTADAAEPSAWWDGQPFDRILLDAPCSASGVIRRHPDVKLRRVPADLPKLSDAQARLLTALWPLLRPGGKLLYVTCSILPEENENTVRAFLAREATAVEALLPADVGRACAAGRQVLPGERGMDGFYYASLLKK